MTDGQKRVGICGIGTMGTQIALRLLERGHSVTAWNRTPSKLAAVIAAGAAVADAPARLADCDVVLLCLLDAGSVEDVVFGPEGVSQSRSAPDIVDHSTIDPDRTRLLAMRFHAATTRDWFDCPVSGGPAAARSGELAVMAGGSAATFEHVRPVLEAYSRSISLLGPAGCGQTAKMCSQTIAAAHLAAVAEAVALAEAAGLDPLALQAALEGGLADSPLLRLFLPLMADPSTGRVGALSTMLKDLEALGRFAKGLGTTRPLGDAVLVAFREAQASGLGEADVSQIVRLFRNS